MIAYAVTIALSAFLLFLVQPVIAKQILPWFGGSAAVWTTCMMFFQTVLLAGYAYSDLLVRRLEPLRQRLVHGVLLLASLAFLPIVVGDSLQPSAGEPPVQAILRLLVLTIGLPYFALSTTGPLLQAWFTRQFPSARVYRLYALSNLFSMLALVAYPPLIEPQTTTHAQSLGWSAAYALFVLLGLWVLVQGARAGEPAVAHVRGADAARADPRTPRRVPAASERVLWLLLPALGSLLLLAVTAHLTHEVAAVPFLWLAPLALYLLSFILCFDARAWYRPRLFPALAGLFCVLMIASTFARVGPGWRLSLGSMPVEQGILLQSTGLFVLCMYLHGELAARKPEPALLTRFYLMVSLGGAAGGVFAAIVAPFVFTSYFELPLALMAIAAVLVFTAGTRVRRLAAVAALAATTSCAAWAVLDDSGAALVRLRNFYGVLRVHSVDAHEPERSRIRLVHGSTMHGEQFTAPALRRRPTTYYGETSGVGRTLERLRTIDEGRALRIGVIGLGAGTLAAWGRPGDVIRFYELDPAVERLARSHFTFLHDSDADVSVEIGDGRLLLERAAPQGFDLLAIDAFSSDSIPVHLLTEEAMRVYRGHLGAGGAIAFHVTNRYLELAPVVRRLADASGMRAIRLDDPSPDEHWWLSRSVWVVVTGNAALAQALLAAGGKEAEIDPRVAIWTDSFSNLFDVLAGRR